MQWFTDADYGLSRLVFQRVLAAVYLVAFLGAARQFRALIGERGMLPVPRYVARVPFRQAPSLFQLRYSDRLFATVAWTGVGCAAALLAGVDGLLPLGGAMALWALPWLLYLSIVNVGQTWYGFGWESLLLEVGFLAVFLGNDEVAPPVLVLFLLRWVLFRVEFGAGLIKMRGDACWRKLTCLYFHHETQPMPGPLSWFFHHLPKPVHRMEVAANHFTQLVVPFLLFTPQPIATWAACLMVVTQVWLVLSGNFAWLNWLTIALGLSVVDFSVLGVGSSSSSSPSSFLSSSSSSYGSTPLWYEVVVVLVGCVLVLLSYRPVLNLVSRRQVMNTSFDPLHLVNSYGAFGSVSRVRHEIVIEGAVEAGDGKAGTGEAVEWRPYEFKGKPGDPGRWPRQFAPYHLRLDWMMWFAALSPAYAEAWFGGLMERLLEGDRDTLRLLRRSPFGVGVRPAVVRARLYRYRYASWAGLRKEGVWWERELVREFFPASRLGR
ncbi:lipase maturation factor family protein [Streptomyces sp. NPDC059009]|uniref:lipase maturation factor family protein n=1 Tax=Streptomyces sp. NPDC059009 TaxID=3346694 RepID=UPI0036BB9D3F